MREIRFGVIGGGLMGREFASAAGRWMHLTDTVAKPVITAISDPSEPARQWFQEHVPTVQTSSTDYRDVLATDVEAVYVAVPHHLHRDIYLDCLRAGKHLMAEKPFGIDLPAANDILAEVRSRPEQRVRCSSEFPFYPAAMRIAAMAAEGRFGEIIEFRGGFLHSSDLDPNKPINWKRRIATNGEYGCMGDLGLHVVHLPLRFGWRPKNVRALLSKVVESRPDGAGGMAPCETWDNAILSCESESGFPMIFETKRISPGDTNTWYIRILGTKLSAEFSTRRPKTLRTMPFSSGQPQAWQEEDLGYDSGHHAITGHIFEFGFPDAILQMWAAFMDELCGRVPVLGCATPDEAHFSHRLFTAALESQRAAQVVSL